MVFRTLWNIWVKIFKNEPINICGRQSLKNLKWSNVKGGRALPPDVIVVVNWYCRILLYSYVCLFYFTFQVMYSLNCISKLNLFWKLFFISSCSKIDEIDVIHEIILLYSYIFLKKYVYNLKECIQLFDVYSCSFQNICSSCICQQTFLWVAFPVWHWYDFDREVGVGQNLNVGSK